jgi:hypothetical protein
MCKQYGERFFRHLLGVSQERQMNIRQKVSVNKVSSQIQNPFCGIHVYHTAEFFSITSHIIFHFHSLQGLVSMFKLLLSLNFFI